MNKVVVLSFIIIVGAVLIGIPMYRFYNPVVLPELDRRTSEARASDTPRDSDAVAARFSDSVWTVAETVNVDIGHGQTVPVVFDFEMTLAPGGVLKCKAHLYSDVQLPHRYQALHSTLEAGWEGTWRVRGNAEVINVKIDNPVRQFRELNAVYPLTVDNLQIRGETLAFSNTHGRDFRDFNRLF